MTRSVFFGLLAFSCIAACAAFSLDPALAHGIGGASVFAMGVPMPAANFLKSSTALPRGLAAMPRAEVPSDPKAAIAALGSAFEEFKATHDERLSAKVDDNVLKEKEDRINSSISELQASIDKMSIDLAAAQMNGGGDAARIDDPDFTEVYSKWFRTGKNEEEVEAQHRAGPRAAMTRGSNPDGGYTAPIEWDRTITHRLREDSPIRQYARGVTISGAGYRGLYALGGTGSGWVGEEADRPETSTPTLQPLDFGVGEIYAMPAASQILLEDSEVDIEAWLADEVEYEFSRQENIAFLSGNGTNKPFGVLTYVEGAANAAKHPYGAIKVVPSGAAATITSDAVLAMIYDLTTTARRNARFFGSRQFAFEVRKLKDGQGNYLWQPTYTEGQPARLAGEALVEVPDMPVVAAGNVSALYGDMAQTYTVIDRLGIQILRDPYTKKPYVLFYTRKRVGGGVHNTEYMRAMQIGTGS